ncbi:hypothetical protein FA13DRAFT_170978 [Coprinellus micaceus]|uniref:Uncharacterized protein n=1 Tax=Coprinellus micaceus TaxID=71717 RepID=A0A4Y7SGM7_COPMI|nr:hypothetical protein FA13DRAFT_170978 [Coprinellus micaceus]
MGWDLMMIVPPLLIPTPNQCCQLISRPSVSARRPSARRCCSTLPYRAHLDSGRRSHSARRRPAASTQRLGERNKKEEGKKERERRRGKKTAAPARKSPRPRTPSTSSPRTSSTPPSARPRRPPRTPTPASQSRRPPRRKTPATPLLRRRPSVSTTRRVASRRISARSPPR